jgi:sugar phosphate permease
MIAVSSLVKDMNMPASWAVCVDIGGKYSGTISGVMNMTGNFGGVAAAWVMGDVLDKYGTTPEVWRNIFYMFAGVHVLGGICWFRVNATEPLLIDPNDGDGETKTVVGDR